MRTKLGDICVIDWGNTSLTKKSYKTNGKYLAVSAKGCDGRIEHYEHEADVCVLSAIGAQCGKMFLPQEKFTAIKNTITLTPNRQKTDGKFLFYLFKHLELPKRGAAQPFISKGDIEKFEIEHLPNLKEQHLIVAKLDKAFAEIDKVIMAKNFNLEKIKQMESSSLKKLLNGNFSNKKIGDICELVYGKGLSKDKRVTGKGEVPVYGANGIKSYTTNPLYQKKSIIVGRKGSAGELQWVEKPFWALDVTYYVVNDDKQIKLKYLYYLLKLQNLPKLAKGVKPGINRNDVYSINIKLPIISEQLKIIENLEKIFEQKSILLRLCEKQLTNYVALKSTILNKVLKHKAA